MRPRSVQICPSSKFKMSSEELHRYREHDSLAPPPLAFEYNPAPPNSGHPEALLFLVPRRHPSAAPPPRPTTANSRSNRDQVDHPGPVDTQSPSPDSTTIDLSLIRGSDALKVTLILSDSLLSFYKDHNFDSCNFCECTTSVLGNEIDVYLSSPPVSASANTCGGGIGGGSVSRGCMCGFSAVVNRRFAVAGNLFWEDESEIASLSITSEAKARALLPPRHRKALSPLIGGHLAVLSQWMRGSLEEFGVRFLAEWVNHAETVSSILGDSRRSDVGQRECDLSRDSFYDYHGKQHLYVWRLSPEVWMTSLSYLLFIYPKSLVEEEYNRLL